jgi:tetratricopeptide (TPR) repeat protein
VWPADTVETLVQHFLPARLHVKDDAEAFKRFGDRYGVHWTPTILVLDPNGDERHRIEGFLPVDEFPAQLLVGRGYVAFHAGRFEEAERYFAEAVQEFPDSDGAAEAQYWAGVARYKASGDPRHLAATAEAFGQHYRDTVWAKKASVWQPKEASG